MKKMMLAAVVAALTVTPAAAAPMMAAPSAVSAPSAKACAKKWEVTGKKVAVRMPEGNAPVASPDSPVVRYLHRGDVVTSCVEAIARTESGPAYRKCGRGGYVWRIVRGGQVPATCLKRL
ncbi:hypothetical protein AB0L55_38265 [Streptomyces anthocyanicus]|uniref:hypothetical protein n=1 Tax=Streptomyces anthocyanicus TaxID=68174 RepID=UPI0034364701